MRYDKQNRKLEALRSEVEKLQAENARLSSEALAIKEILDATLHEVRRLSAQASKFAERLSRDTKNTHVSQTALSVFYTVNMMSSRLAYTDIELNPRALENQTPVRSGIYKKFDKASRILADEARERGVTIKLEGDSWAEIDALPVFELLPFVLLDNSIKYTPPNQAVTVAFEISSGRQVVTVKSIGPSVTAEELPKLFEKGFRAATTAAMPGQGLGLFLAKQVCEFHDIRISAEAEQHRLFALNGVGYSQFRVVLSF